MNEVKCQDCGTVYLDGEFHKCPERRITLFMRGKDYKACCDDLCHGGGCLKMGGYEMLRICDFCKGIIDDEIPECSSCTCDDGGDEAIDI